MTIVAVTKSRDCLAIGTDSMTTVVGPGANGTTQVLKGYSNATKLFQLGTLPIAIATWGIGNIGSLSVGGMVSDFQSHIDSKPTIPKTIPSIAQELATFVQTLYANAFPLIPVTPTATKPSAPSITPSPKPTTPDIPALPPNLPILGFFLGGYSVNVQLPELWEVRFPGPMINLVRGPNDFGANWRGIEIPYSRLYFGFDPRIADVLTNAGVSPQLIQQVSTQFAIPVIFDSMPIQDTIAFTEHILRTTIGVSTYEMGQALCGDPIQVAVIVRRRGYVWVHEPAFHV
jgi:hypothetical protein